MQGLFGENSSENIYEKCKESPVTFVCLLYSHRPFLICSLSESLEEASHRFLSFWFFCWRSDACSASSRNTRRLFSSWFLWYFHWATAPSKYSKTRWKPASLGLMFPSTSKASSTSSCAFSSSTLGLAWGTTEDWTCSNSPVLLVWIVDWMIQWISFYICFITLLVILDSGLFLVALFNFVQHFDCSSDLANETYENIYFEWKVITITVINFVFWAFILAYESIIRKHPIFPITDRPRRSWHFGLHAFGFSFYCVILSGILHCILVDSLFWWSCGTIGKSKDSKTPFSKKKSSSWDSSQWVFWSHSHAIWSVLGFSPFHSPADAWKRKKKAISLVQFSLVEKKAS